VKLPVLLSSGDRDDAFVNCAYYHLLGPGHPCSDGREGNGTFLTLVALGCHHAQMEEGSAL
jgi:hypothetical protein